MTDPGDQTAPIFGTVMFDGEMAQKGYGLNKMCYSFNQKKNRDAFLADQEAYMDRFALTEPQKQAIRDKVVLDMLAEGGNIYYLAKFAGIFGLNMQQVGAQQTGMTVEAFQEKLNRAGD
ncbi:MAG: protocatechuate 4,5-dioxygenase subunit alpha [Rhodospirillaceae bacterium]